MTDNDSAGGNADRFTIRTVREEDAGRLRELRLEALRTCPTAFGADSAEDEARPLEWWQDLARRGAGEANDAIFIAVDGDGHFVGMTGVHGTTKRKEAHRGYVWGVYVRPAARGRRLGDRLIGAAIDWSRGKGLRVLTLGVAVGNDPARHCYDRAGFTVYGRNPMVLHVDGVFYDEWLMAIKL
jgi:ribosomal protein S18 acetylase RimI-like enzyme